MQHYAFKCPKKAKPEVVQEALAAVHGEAWYEDTYDQFDGSPAEWVAAAYGEVEEYSKRMQQANEKTKAELKEAAATKKGRGEEEEEGGVRGR